MCALPAGSVAVELTNQDRAWRTNLESPHGQAPVVTVHREIIGLSPENEVITREPVASGSTRTMNTELLTLPTEKVTLASGKVLTTAEIMEGVKLTLDRWRTEDLTPPPEPEA